jgi:hypothetical protein
MAEGARANQRFKLGNPSRYPLLSLSEFLEEFWESRPIRALPKVPLEMLETNTVCTLLVAEIHYARHARMGP